MDLKALVLAAGKGTRLHSEQYDVPKVMRRACGRPLLSYVTDALSFLPPEDIILVVGYKKEAVIKAFPQHPYAVQEQQLGTGHAVMAAAELLRDHKGALLVCCGDMPLMRRESYEALVRAHEAEGNLCTLLSGSSDRELPYGRVLRNEDGSFRCVVEDKDCTPEQRAIRELNAGVYVFDTQPLLRVLTQLRCDNAQGEYYLTDAPTLLQKEGRVGVCQACSAEEMLGVNTPEQLQAVETALGRT